MSERALNLLIAEKLFSHSRVTVNVQAIRYNRNNFRKRLFSHSFKTDRNIDGVLALV